MNLLTPCNYAPRMFVSKSFQIKNTVFPLIFRLSLDERIPMYPRFTIKLQKYRARGNELNFYSHLVFDKFSSCNVFAVYRV